MRRQVLSILIPGLVVNMAYAESLHAVRPLPGYTCMQLALSPAELTSKKVGVPVYGAPSTSSAVEGYAANTMLLQSPQQPTSGFLKVLWPSGQSGWMQAQYLKPWSNPYAPASRCVPSIMSDGKPGIATTH